MRLKIPLIIFFSLVAGARPVLAEQSQFQLGTVYTDRPGEVSMVVELPLGTIPEAKNFRLRIDDQKVLTGRDLKPFKLSGRRLALAICLDVSGTMKGDPLEETKKALLSFSAEVRADDRLALISFADNDEIESSFDETREHFAEAVRRMKTKGGKKGKTRLYQALYKSFDRFKGSDFPQRKRIIIISDGKDEGSAEDAKSVTTKAKASGIPIDAIGRGKIAPQYVEALRVLANDSGGTFVHARPDILALADAIERIYRDLLETRSLLIYFKYDMDDAGQMTRNVLIELQLPGQAPHSIQISDEIPLPRVEPESRPKPILPPAPNGWRFWWLLLMVVIMGIGLFLWIWYRGGKKTKEDQAPEEVITTREHDVPPPQIKPTPVVVPEPRPPKMTQVGGYYYPAPEPGQPTAVLIGLSGPVEGQQFAIEKDTFHIGASQENDLNIDEDDYVSGEHAYIRHQGGSLYIFDKGSQNRTFVNKIEVTETGLSLSLGDRIDIGMSTLEVMKAPS